MIPLYPLYEAGNEVRMRSFFELNREIVLFVYGQAFFVMGLAIFLQSRRYSRLQLAHDLRWLAAFGVIARIT
jgi:hypothetical protein